MEHFSFCGGSEESWAVGDESVGCICKRDCERECELRWEDVGTWINEGNKAAKSDRLMEEESA